MKYGNDKENKETGCKEKLFNKAKNCKENNNSHINDKKEYFNKEKELFDQEKDIKESGQEICNGNKIKEIININSYADSRS